MTRRPPGKTPKRPSTFQKILKDLDEETASSEEEDFESVSTDNQATNYNLNYTNESIKSRKRASQPSTSKQATLSKSALKRTDVSDRRSTRKSDQTNRLAARNTRSSPRKNTRSSPRKNTSRVRFSEVEGNDDRNEESNATGDDETDDSEPERSVRASRSKSKQGSTRHSNERTNQSRASTSQNHNRSKERSEATTERRKEKKERSRKQKHPKKHKTKVLKEIIRLQRAVDTLIPKLTFSRLIREILMQYSDRGMRISLVALQAIQESAELYLVQLFEDSYRCTIHRNRVTLLVKDMELVRFLRGPTDPGNH